MAESKDRLLSLIRDQKPISEGQQLRLALLLALPAIFAQVSSVLLQYIDAAMVGHLGATPSASIGLVSTSTWIFVGFFMAVNSGFSVQVAHRCGAKDFRNAGLVVRQGLFTSFVFTVFLSAIALAISGRLPYWLGGTEEICKGASGYFSIYSAFMPVAAVGYAANAMLQASGNVKVPSILYVCLGVFDVIFNYIFIYRCDMGVSGAALGTGVAQVLVSSFAVWYLLTQSKELSVKGEKVRIFPERKVLKNAFVITGPMWLQNIIMRGAYVMSTIIVAPLGPISIAANSFAITAESFCYMPGYGLEEAATTLVGQSLGAKRKDIARRFAKVTVLMAMGMMSILAIAMFILSPQLMGLLSNDPEVVALGAKILRIEAFAETLYAVSIVGYGACVGAGDTLVPSLINFISMWIVRIGLAIVLTPKLGLTGYWIAMCIELNVRGILFAVRLKGDRWLKTRLI